MKNYLILILTILCYNTFAQNHGAWFGTKASIGVGLNYAVIEHSMENGGYFKNTNFLMYSFDMEFNSGKIFGLALKYQYNKYKLYHRDIYRIRTKSVNYVDFDYNVVTMDFRFYKRDNLNSNGIFVHFGPSFHFLKVHDKSQWHFYYDGETFKSNSKIGTITNIHFNLGFGGKWNFTKNQFIRINAYVQIPVSYWFDSSFKRSTEGDVKSSAKRAIEIGNILIYGVSYGINIR